jgi:tRNA(adenine34) deaminase
MKASLPSLKKHHKYMRRAFALAQEAKAADEIPVGAVVVKEDRIIGRGYNQTELLNDATAHAEMIAISAANATLGNKYLHGCTLYVTLEPCPMCTGALVWSKIDRVVFGAADTQAGACGSIFNLGANTKLNHQIEIIQGIMEEDCEQILKDFFAQKRSTSNGTPDTDL